jgi:hypothetical protein
MKFLAYPKKLFSTFGVNPFHLFYSLKNLPGYIGDYLIFRRKAKRSSDPFTVISCYPCLTDKNAQGGTASGHYFWQDLIIAQRIFSRNPRAHLDIGSRLDGFVAHVASFRHLDVLDIRPVKSSIPNICFVQGDMSDPGLINCLGFYDSISCLHVLEHCGLGRYGDKIDPSGYVHATKVISSLISPSGTLYLSVPIGKERIEFNAHRVFNPNTILRLFESQGMRLKSFAYVNDEGDFIDSTLPHPELGAEHSLRLSYDGNYGCGIFEFKKL